jgi:hypothetical protein
VTNERTGARLLAYRLAYNGLASLFYREIVFAVRHGQGSTFLSHTLTPTMATDPRKRKAGPDQRDGGNRKKTKVSSRFMQEVEELPWHQAAFSPSISSIPSFVVLSRTTGQAKVDGARRRESGDPARRHRHLGDMRHEQGSTISHRPAESVRQGKCTPSHYTYVYTGE